MVALTWATARTVVLAATANIFLRDDEVGCVNGVDNRKPEEEESREGRVWENWQSPNQKSSLIKLKILAARPVDPMVVSFR